MCPFPDASSTALLEWKVLQQKFKGCRILTPGGIAFAASQFVFAGHSGDAVLQSGVQFAAPGGVQSAWSRR